jgi:hypothetical protein
LCYQNRRSYDEEANSPECAFPQKQYFWLDALHPTPPIHEAMAAEVQILLQENRFVDRETGNATSSGAVGLLWRKQQFSPTRSVSVVLLGVFWVYGFS